MNDIINDSDIILDELDTSWLDEFEKVDNDYHDYYSEELSFINLNCIYVNSNSEIERIIEEKIILHNPSIISRDELLSIIKNNAYVGNLKYSLLSILKFNIDIEPVNLNTFLKNDNESIGSKFLQNIKRIDAIPFNKSISLFHDLNTLTLIFYKKNPNNNIRVNTKKIFISSLNRNRTRRN
jgi:hypothetical protein